MSKQLQCWLTSILCFLTALALPAQTLRITAPANGATNVSIRPNIVATATSTGNTSPNPYETIYFELSADPSFNASQPAPNYQRTGLYIKNFDSPANFNWQLTNPLAFDTQYYARAVSNKTGPSAAVSFRTQSNPNTITAPGNGATDVFLRPTIVLTATSTGNTSPNPYETIYFELSADPSFSTSQPAPNYQRTGLYIKNFDSPANFTFVPVQLLPNTQYYVRAFSNKFGFTAPVTFTTRGLRPPRIVFPANGQTGVSQTPSIQAFSNSVENVSPNAADRIYIEVSKDPSFNTAQPLPNYQFAGDYIRNTDVPVTYTYDIPPSRALELGQTYYTRAVSRKNGSSPVVSFTVSGIPVLDTTYLQNVDGQSAAAVRYANKYQTTLNARFILGANLYEWELDADGDFVNTPAQFKTTTGSSNLLLQADAPGLVSGQLYYVRVRGRKTVGTPIIGPWSGEKATDRFVFKFYNALHPATLTSLYPGGVSFEEDDGGVKLFAPNVANAGTVMFQVDDDPNFGSPYSLPPVNPVFTARNGTYPGVNGTVFFANVVTNGLLAFEYLSGLVNGTYYVRARAFNDNQSGYWHTVRSFTINIPHAPIVAVNMPNNATEVPTYFDLQVLDDTDYLERAVDLQVSSDNFATTVVNVVNGPLRGNIPSALIPLTDLKFNTTYQIRLRNYIYNYPTNPTPWTVVTFKTQVAPRIVVSAVPPSPWPTTGPSVYASKLPGVDQFDWQIEKTNAPVSSSSKTTTVSYVNFYGYVQAGGQYRIRVRGNATAQGITGVWSDWVSFSVAATAAPRIAAAQSYGDDAPEAGAVTQVYPNPFAGTTRLYPGASSSEQTLVVTDVTGKVVEQRQLSGAQPVELGASWRSGVYVIRVVDPSGTVRTMRVLKR